MGSRAQFTTAAASASNSDSSSISGGGSETSSTLHECKTCSKSFQTLFNLRRHMKTATHLAKIDSASSIDAPSRQPPPPRGPAAGTGDADAGEVGSWEDTLKRSRHARAAGPAPSLPRARAPGAEERAISPDKRLPWQLEGDVAAPGARTARREVRGSAAAPFARAAARAAAAASAAESGGARAQGEASAGASAARTRGAGGERTGARLELVINVDGASRGNPGAAAYGVTIRDGAGGKVKDIAKSIGFATCNEAEWRACISALNAAFEMRATKVTIRCDSKLVVEQLTGKWKVNKENLRVLHREAKSIANRLEGPLEMQWVARAENSAADSLANYALDSGDRTWEF
ncbi:ribonuclease H-like domain-containing protein [Baffinella frigidus]|nr:ribonuclease H-like domain-containing protein [Cryptophyta sp. CCMP2293]